MSISSEINRISGNVSDALAAIANKGVTVPSGSNSDDLADLIGQISGGGGTTWETIYDDSLNITLTDDYTYYYNTISYSGNIEQNSVWRVTWNGDQYLCTATSTGDPLGIPYAIGNDTIIHEQGGNDEPFFIQRIFANNDLYVFASQSQTVNLIIEKQVSSGAVLVPKTITQNGTYDPADDNADGYSEVTVNVQGSTTWETVYEGAINLSSDWGNGYYYANLPTSALSESIPYGSVWRIVWDGVPYECTATEFVDTGGNPYCLGNCTYDGGQSGTEFPFFMQTYFSSNEWYVVGEQGTFVATIQKQVSGGGGIDFPTFTVTMDSEYTTISSITCDKTYSECAEIGDNHQYYAEFEIHAGNNTFTAGAILTDIIEGQLVYSIGTTDVAWLIIRFNEIGTITGTIDPIPFRDGSDLTESGGTVTVPAGYYEQQETKTVASGTAGTPTATKGTVSNHSVSITPSVTNTTGYITGSTKTGTAVTVTASELASGNKEITSNGNNIDVVGYSTVSVNVPSGSGKNAQIAPGFGRTNQTAYTAISGQSLTVAKTGTYDVYWTGYRSSTGGTNGSQLYIEDSSYGSANTTFDSTLTNCQSVHLSNVSLTQNQTVAVYARARGTQYYMYIFGLTIIEA